MMHAPLRAFSARPSHCARFEIHADRCAQALPRIVGAFAAQDLLPRSVQSRQSCGGLWIAIEIDLEGPRADRMAERLRAMVAVSAVVLIRYPDPAPVPLPVDAIEVVRVPQRERIPA